MSAQELLRDTSTWTTATAAAAFPILIRRAMDGMTITYGGLKALAEPEAVGHYALQYRTVAGRIGDICVMLASEMDEVIPPLNAIIVNKKSGLPSEGVNWYLAKFLGLTERKIDRLTGEDRDCYAQGAINAVLEFGGWDRVRKHLGLVIPSPTSASPRNGTAFPPPNPKNFAKGKESKAHQDLKAWVKEHPEAFKDYGKFDPGKTEVYLSSGDKLDVHFSNKKTQLAVEVKAKEASDDEVRRGVYQCIKYRATLRAMQLAGTKPPNAQTVLVLDREPLPTVAELAALLSVTILIAKPVRMGAVKDGRKLPRSGAKRP